MKVSLVQPDIYKVDVYISTSFEPYEFTVSKGERGGDIGNSMQHAEPNPGTAAMFNFVLQQLVGAT